MTTLDDVLYVSDIAPLLSLSASNSPAPASMSRPETILLLNRDQAKYRKAL